jgi:hypothetical protein
MSDIKPTLSDIKVALVMGFSMFDGQDAGDALDDYIAEVRADALDKAVERVMARDGYIIGFDDYADGWLVGRNDAVAAIRGDDDVCGCGPTACDLHREARHEVAKRRADIHGEGEK